MSERAVWQSVLLSLSNEIWMIIIAFISVKKLCQLRFLCWRFFTIVSLSKKIEYYRNISHNIVDVQKLYKCFIHLYHNVLFDRLVQFQQSTYLYLRFRLEPVKNLFLYSNISIHLFHCPRSNYALNNCSNCCRLSIDPLFYLIDSAELRYNLILVNRAFVDDVKRLFKEHFITQFILNICYKSLQHYTVLNSNWKRYLQLSVIQNPCGIIIKFCKVFVRILYYFFILFLKSYQCTKTEVSWGKIF